MGEEIEYKITYKNNGNFALEKPKLMFELPEHSLTEDNRRRITKDLVALEPGDGDSITFKTRLLGKEQEEKIVRVWLTYVPHNLSVRYESEATVITTIANVPISLNYENFPSSAAGGSEVGFSLRYASQVDYPLENMSVRLSPVDGFTVKSSTPSSLDKSEWKLPTLTKGAMGQISVLGSVSINNEVQLRFPVRLGMWIDGVFVIVKEASHVMQVIPSQLPEQSAKLEVSQSAEPGEGKYQISWLVKTSVNDAKNIMATATLPPNVHLEDMLIPETEAEYFSFNPSNRKLSWIVGNLSSGGSKSVTFQVVPSGIGIGATLIEQVVASGEDQLTGKAVQATAPSLTTTFISL